MRIIFFVGIPRVALSTAMATLPDAIAVESGGDVELVESPTGHSIWRRIVRSVTIAGKPSAAPSRAWSIWAVAHMGDAEGALKAFRWLARYRLTYPDRVLGPYDPKRFLGLAADREDDDGKPIKDYFPAGSLPWAVFGDDPVALMTEEYAPDDTVVMAD